MKKLLTLLLSMCMLLCVGIGLTACGDGDTGKHGDTGKQGPMGINVNGAPREINDGEYIELYFELIYDAEAQGERDTDLLFTWESTDGGVSCSFQPLYVNLLSEESLEAVYLMVASGNGIVTVMAYSTAGNASVQFTIDVLGAGAHRCTPGYVQIENEVEATCSVAGSYDEVTRCTTCGEIVGKTTYQTDPLEHEEMDYPVSENEVPSTCQAYGSYDEVYYCRHCGDEMSRENKNFTSLGGHTGGAYEEVVLKKPTCTTGGRAQSVKLCTVCGEVAYLRSEYDLGALHTMENDVCTLCGARESSAGLVVDPYWDETAEMLKYKVRSLGTCTAKDLVVDAYQGHPISMIDSEAFANATDLESVTFGKSIETIYDEAFSGCKNLKKIEFTGSVKYLRCIASGINAEEAVAVYVPTLNDWISLQTGGFDPIGAGFGYELYINNEKLTDLVIPATCTTVPKNRFMNCRSIETLTLSEGVTEVEEQAFGYCFNLKSTEFPSTLRTIGGGAFFYTSMENITLNEGLQTLGNSAFSDCQTTVKSLTIPSTAISTDLYTFYDSTIEKVYISNVANWVQYFAFVGMSANELYINGTLAEEIEVPTGITEVLSYTFNYKHIRSVTLPEGVQTIDGWAFEGAKGLVSVTLPSTLKTIGRRAFADCEKLDGVVLPDGLETIADVAFRNCKALQSITIPDSVTVLGDENGYVFFGCSALKSVKIGKGVTVIKSYSFYSCSSLSALTLGENVQTVQICAFAGCALTQLSIPNSVVTLEASAFGGNSSLQTLTLGNQLQTIGDGAFANCTALQSVTVPDSVITIGESAFSRCTKLASVTIGSGVKYIGSYAFQNCALTSVDFGVNTSGWYRTQTKTATSGTSCSASDLSNPATMAKWLSKDYESYYFKRN